MKVFEIGMGKDVEDATQPELVSINVLLVLKEKERVDDL